MRTILISTLLSACAQHPLPRCGDVGCPQDVICPSRTSTECFCPQPDGDSAKCERLPLCSEVGCESTCSGSGNCAQACEC